MQAIRKIPPEFIAAVKTQAEALGKAGIVPTVQNVAQALSISLEKSYGYIESTIYFIPAEQREEMGIRKKPKPKGES